MTIKQELWSYDTIRYYHYINGAQKLASLIYHTEPEKKNNEKN